MCVSHFADLRKVYIYFRIILRVIPFLSLRLGDMFSRCMIYGTVTIITKSDIYFLLD